MPFSMHFDEGPHRDEAQKRRRAGWHGDALILTLCFLGLLSADLFATGGRNTRAVIGGVGAFFQQSTTLIASATRR